MASPPLLDFEALLAPIPGDDPVGGRVPFEVNDELTKAREEIDPGPESENDPLRPEPKKADWVRIIGLAQETLTNTSKDLQVAARLTEALTKEKGFGGLRDGLRLMRRLIEECWDRVNPSIEDGDLEVRGGPFTWLDDPRSRTHFPTTLRLVPMVVGPGGAYSWSDWRQSQDGKGDVSREDFEKAILATPAEHCQDLLEDLTESYREAIQIGQVLNAKMGADAPGMTGIRQVLDECLSLAKDIVQRKGPAAAAEPAANGEAAASADGAAGPAARAVTTREEAYRQLAAAAATLQRLEPHSPIPYLVQRAVELGGLPFPQLMRALIREPNVLAELSRELGIKEEAPPSE
jgi:type VI secretion system protein ImpA